MPTASGGFDAGRILAQPAGAIMGLMIPHPIAAGARYVDLKCMCCSIFCAQHVGWRVSDELARIETTCCACDATGTVTVRSSIVEGFGADDSQKAVAKAMAAATQALPDGAAEIPVSSGGRGYGIAV
jgi:hypothetical protein